MSDSNPGPVFARGCDLSAVPLAADVAPADLKAILGVDTSNPYLRNLRIEQGFLKRETLPDGLRNLVPIKGILEPLPIREEPK